MAQYIGFVQGGRGEASRIGTKSSGMEAIARGWNIGGVVTVTHDEKRGDVVTFWTDGGSRNKNAKELCSFYEDGEIKFKDATMQRAYQLFKELEAEAEK